MDSPFADPVRCKEQLTKLINGVHKYNCKLFVQLWSGFGRIAFPMAMEGDLVAPSACENRWDPESMCRALTVDKIHRIIKAHVDAAVLCKECGTDGVNIVAAYGGYLGDQFCMEIWNHRTDEYGGSLENRARMNIEIIRGIKEACGEDFPVTCRFSVKNHMKAPHHGHMPDEQYTEVGRDTEDSIALAKLLVDAGAGKMNRVVDADIDSMVDLINLNCAAPTILSRLFGADMVARNKGRIMNVASLGAVMPDPYFNVYGPSKAFDYFLSAAMYGELQDSEVTVSTLLSGPIKTNWAKNAGKADSGMARDPRDNAMEGFVGMQKGKLVIVATLLYKVGAVLARLLPLAVIATTVANWQSGLIDKK